MDRVVRVGLLGAGGIAPEHADALHTLPGVRMVAVCDRFFPRAEELRARYGLPAAFCTLREMLSGSDVDVVHVLLPPELHVPLAMECLAGGRHVFVEKPLGLGVDECAILAEAAAKAKRSVGVNHNVVFSPVMRELASVVREGRIGRVEHVSVCQTRPASQMDAFPANHFMWKAPENMLFEFAPHPLSVVRALVGGPVRTSTILSDEKKSRAGSVYHRRWESSLVCERGTAQCMFTFGRGCRHFSAQVFGEDGVISVDFVRSRLELHETGRYRREELADTADALANARLAFGGVAARVRDRVAGYLGGKTRPTDIGASIAAFYDALRRGEPPPEGLAEGSAVVALCEEIWRNQALTPTFQPAREHHVAVG